MKPIVIAVENGKIVLTKEQFEKYLSDAYEEGKRDGTVTVPYLPTNFPSDNPYKPYVTWCDSTK